MKVRSAERRDLAAIEQLAHVVLWDAYSQLIGGIATEALHASEFSQTALKRSLLRGGLAVAVDREEIVGFSDTNVNKDHVAMLGLWTVDPAAVLPLLRQARQSVPGAPLSLDVLLGESRSEHLVERWGFVPGETIETERAGVPIVRRRWWAPSRFTSTVG